jgi:hypothetical protein
MLKKILFLTLLLSAGALALAPSNRITLPNGRQVFVSGMNLAWINYAADVGDVALDTNTFKYAVQDIRDSGGNVIRVWLSTNGANDPKYGTDSLVSGLGSQTINNVKRMLNIAGRNGVLVMPVLLSHNLMESPTAQTGLPLAQNTKLLTTDAGIQAYIDHAVVPLVTAIGLDTNLICWEIFNEPEGMVANIGWTAGGRVQKINVQKVVNRVTGAIHRAVPGVLVSNGAQTFSTSSDITGNSNWYSDINLTAAGADNDGTLDFYMVHYYPWNGASYSPFTYPLSHWNLDKPVVIGEFPAASWSSANANQPGGYHPIYDAANIDTLFTNLYNGGYAGALSWCYMGDTYDPWLGSFNTSAKAMKTLYTTHSDAIKIKDVTRAQTTGNGVLQVTYQNSDNSVWSSLKKDTTANLSNNTTISVDVLIPKASVGSFKFHWVLKTGSGFEWDVSDTYCSPAADSSWSTCTANLASMYFWSTPSKKADLTQVKSIYLHFSTNNSFNGKIWFDNIKLDNTPLYGFDNGKTVFAVDAYSAIEASKVTGLEVIYPAGSTTSLEPLSRKDSGYRLTYLKNGIQLSFAKEGVRTIEVRNLLGQKVASVKSSAAQLTIPLKTKGLALVRVIGE